MASALDNSSITVELDGHEVNVSLTDSEKLVLLVAAAALAQSAGGALTAGRSLSFRYGDDAGVHHVTIHI